MKRQYLLVLTTLLAAAFVACTRPDSAGQADEQVGGLKVGMTRGQVEHVLKSPGIVLVEDIKTYHYFPKNAQGTLAISYEMIAGNPRPDDRVVAIEPTQVSSEGERLIEDLKHE